MQNISGRLLERPLERLLERSLVRLVAEKIRVSSRSIGVAIWEGSLGRHLREKLWGGPLVRFFGETLWRGTLWRHFIYNEYIPCLFIFCVKCQIQLQLLKK